MLILKILCCAESSRIVVGGSSEEVDLDIR